MARNSESIVPGIAVPGDEIVDGKPTMTAKGKDVDIEIDLEGTND